MAAAEARAEERASYVATAEARAEELASHAVWLTSELEAARRELAQRDAVELARRDATVEPVAEQVRADDRATEAPTPTDEAPAEEAPAAAAAEEAVTEDTSAEDAVEEEDAVAEDTSADAPTAGPASDPPARDLLTRAMLLVASVAMMVASVVLTMRAAPDERRRQARLQLGRAHAQKKRQQAATQRAAAVASTRSPGALTIAALCDAASPATAGRPGAARVAAAGTGRHADARDTEEAASPAACPWGPSFTRARNRLPPRSPRSEANGKVPGLRGNRRPRSLWQAGARCPRARFVCLHAHTQLAHGKCVRRPG